MINNKAQAVYTIIFVAVIWAGLWQWIKWALKYLRWLGVL